jgi:hypothetical protein
VTGKTDFTDLYEGRGPRDYYAYLGHLEYQAPVHGLPVFRRLCDVLRQAGNRPTVLDLCCSFGVNAALLNHNVTFDELHEHYVSPGRAQLSHLETLAADHRFFAERRRDDAVQVIGLDVASQAVEYAVTVGLLAEGVSTNLEAADPPCSIKERLARVDLVIVTGGASYVRERTFETIVACAAGELPWIAALTLRWIGFDPIAKSLERHGLVTERLDGYVVRQRRFADQGERRHVLEALAKRGLQPNHLEEDGWHTAEMYVTRPSVVARELPLRELLSDVVDGQDGLVRHSNERALNL